MNIVFILLEARALTKSLKLLYFTIKRITRFNTEIHNILVKQGFGKQVHVIYVFLESRQTNTCSATDRFKIYLSPVGVKSHDTFIINVQAGAKPIRHVRQFNGFVTLNMTFIRNVVTGLKGTRG